MSNSTNLNLPYLLANQAQKHVTHNEALKMLDVLVQLSVVDNTLSAPPQSPSEGDSYTIATSPTGDWAGKEYQVTIWHDGAWSFYPPNKGWITWVESNNTLQAYNGTDWVDISGVLSASTAPILGINAVADTTNRLSINSGAILFNKEVDDVQVKLNKQASTDNASFLFQTNFSGRAEIGTTGNDDFHFKVSSDGVTWNDGILINKSTGEVSFPNTTFSGTGSIGPKGDKGDKGDTGAAGVDGQDGVDGAIGADGAKGDKGDKGDKGETITVDLNKLVTRIFERISPAQWGFCHVVSEAYIDLAKTTKAIATDDVVAVIEDKSPNNIDLVAGGTSASTKIKLRLDPVTVGVDESHLTTHFLKVTVPTGGFEGKLITAYRSGCIVSDVVVPAGEWEIWSGHGIAVKSGFIGVFAAEAMSNVDISEVLRAFYYLGAGSKPIFDASYWATSSTDDYYKTLNLDHFDFSYVTTCYKMFQIDQYNVLNRITLNGADLSSVVDMSYLFYRCFDLNCFDVSNWDVSSVINMSSMFSRCYKLTTLDVTKWDTSSVTNMGWMFYNSTKFTHLDISNWDLSSVTDMSHMFRNCTKLKSITIGSAFDNTACVNFTSAFNNSALNQQTVDDILVGIETAGTSNGTVHLNGGTNAAPSNVGTVAKTALLGRGWSVTTA